MGERKLNIPGAEGLCAYIRALADGSSVDGLVFSSYNHNEEARVVRRHVIHLADRIAALEGQVAEARAFGEEAARQHNALLASKNILRCAFCDAEYPPDIPPTQHEALTAHVMQCEKHPLRKRIADLEAWRGALVSAAQLWLHETASDEHTPHARCEPEGRAIMAEVIENYPEPLLVRWTDDYYHEQLDALRKEARNNWEALWREKEAGDG